MPSRRAFLNRLALAVPAAGLSQAASAASAGCAVNERVTLDGLWDFRLDTEPKWKTVTVPHTWQTAAESAGFYGVGWYERVFDVPKEWSASVVRMEFEAVFHSATVWVNGRPAGEHLRKGYTAFTLDITPHLKWGAPNTMRLRADNSFDEHMPPRGHSSAWAHDAGIYRPVSLLATPADYIERVDVDATPDLKANTAALRITPSVHGQGQVHVTVIEEDSGRIVLEKEAPVTVTLANPRLWHFDHQHLYRLIARLSSGHIFETTFGIRLIEARGGAFYLNGERVRLTGVERMAGSNPEYGMAEPAHWIAHDHADMKELNCIYTRVHWQQDRRLLDYCDRHGIPIQTEVPTWGGDTFRGMGAEPDADIMQNGLEQLRETIARDRNHPCIFSWGICNEINGQNPPAAAVCQAHVCGSQGARSYAAGDLRLEFAAADARQRRRRTDGLHHVERVLRELVRRHACGHGAQPRRHPSRLSREAYRDLGVRLLRVHGGTARRRRQANRGTARAQRRVPQDRLCRGTDFFCYNDYRTHIGDKGTGVMKQRVHGVVDVYGARKPSWQALRAEASPVESMAVTGEPGQQGDLRVTVRTWASVPCYTLRGYTDRAVVYGDGAIPAERVEAALPVLEPGQEATVRIQFQEKTPARVQVDLMRPTGFSAHTAEWKP